MTDKMTPEQALKYFKHRISTKGQCGENTTQRQAFEVAIETLEKQIPKKPNIKESKYIEGYDIPYCPNCGWNVVNNYCNCCGQHLDWESDTE